ncbi:MAG: NAD-dependent protein deacetylase, SIR2 family [Lachnospiraceae bacterium]|nr:NAD-dependent protein deacetylase, SIR2 family [Lachnospiraceae bacterium]
MNQYKEIAEKIKNADALLIGASNGLSITEGLHLFADNQAFEELFGDLKRKYGIRNILQAVFTNWPTEEEKWGVLSRLIQHYSGEYQETEVMADLKSIVGDKPYFVVTSNAEGHFELSGFESDKVYEVEGNWLEMRCSRLCHDTMYPALEAIQKMAAAETDGKIPSELIPRCPKCGAVMTMYNAEPLKPGMEQAWHQFLEAYHNKNLVILELGIGWRNQLIKAPLMGLAEREPNAVYITINLGEIYIADSIVNKSYGLDGYLSDILRDIKKEME